MGDLTSSEWALVFMATINSLQSIPLPLPIFDGTDYGLWEKKMKTLFKSQNLWDIVNEQQNTCINEAQRKDASALYLIQQSLAQNIFRRITEASTAKDAWDLLRKEFLGDPKLENKSPILPTPWDAAMEGDWKRMMDYYRDEEHLRGLSSPVTRTLDTVLHLAVHDKDGNYCEDLLEFVRKKQLSETEFLKKTNKFGNTALHEATIYDNYQAVKLLVECCPDLIEKKNNFGETPLFTAAGFAETKIVEFLIGSGLKQCLDDNGRLLDTHKERKDELSILSAAIIGQNFETAYLLLELDTSLASLKNSNKISSLQLLAEMPTAFESGSVPMATCKRFIYNRLPDPSPCEVKSKAVSLSQERKRMGDLECGRGRYSVDHLRCGSEKNQRGGLLNCYKIPKGWLESIRKQKRNDVFALTLAESLIKNDKSLTKGRKKNKKAETQSQTSGTNQITMSSLTTKKEMPLFTATRRGVKEIVELIIKLHPHAIDQSDKMNRSVLDMAVMYRQRKIFDIIVGGEKLPLARMRRVVDNSGNTLLHHVADMMKNSGVTNPGPALQLQEELKWFEVSPFHPLVSLLDTGLCISYTNLIKKSVSTKLSNPIKLVKDKIPSHYVLLLNKEGKTARECFEIAHEEQLQKAQTWIKETSQSCSTVAALVSTVVFAAAYTVPGGSDEKGKPIFINSPYFLVFTVTDVVSLASSLTSLVMFLSLLTSPFELPEFLTSLPRKLIFGLFFLFLSVVTSMISFGATILILIQTERKFTTLLLSIASFFPVFLYFKHSQDKIASWHLFAMGKKDSAKKINTGDITDIENYSGQPSEILSKSKELQSKEVVQHPTAQPSVMNSTLTSNEQISLFIATGNGIEEIKFNVKNSSLTKEERIPLFLATRNGIEEIVGETIERHPHAVEKLNDKGQSILDVSVMHRQKKIFSLVKQQKIPLASLHRVLDTEDNTLFHHVADMEHYRGGTKPGPTLQLQEELQRARNGRGANKKRENYSGQPSEILSKSKELQSKEVVQHPTAQPSVMNSTLTSNEQISLFIATGNGIEEIKFNVKNSSLTKEERIPLFLATRNGIEEIVGETIERHPHAVEKLNDKGQSILDVSVMHRQKKIFSLVKQQKIPLASLHRVLDTEDNTLFHHVADMEHYRGGTKPGPTLQLQEELQCSRGKTAGELFKESHKEQLENAQKWIKETTQSCSTVAALVATVVFVAAYTVPGGSDDSGKPNFIDSPYFLVFTVSDVFSLASSLTSLVVFLSLLTSLFDLKEFHISLPQKLLVGFTFLFFVVITTMLSFGATILILIQSERKLTTLLLSIAAFLPVLVFAIMQFRLYVSFMGSTVNIRKITEKALSVFHVPCLPRGKKLRRAD
ncbi:hypothetical protein SADUNF_Sadunf11G0008000 [Salix dunnii]|uniref:PGG domain-containing protein n=1 Tax=Salix dunnii TaxID=1413687 RepID=A0A835JP83_9ROSI|nr:hypothetical protein SADUNF_Sadunf11G0008000 [Salix dunnii]